MSADLTFQLRRDPIEHWRKVLETPGLSWISYRLAREALDAIDRPGRERQPRGDDEAIA